MAEPAPGQALDAACHAAEFVRAFRAAAGRGGRGGEDRGDDWDVAWHSNVIVLGKAVSGSMKAIRLVAIGEPPIRSYQCLHMLHFWRWHTHNPRRQMS